MSSASQERGFFYRNTANLVTWTRIALCILLLWPIIWHKEWVLTVIFPLMAVAGLTDKLDGLLARKLGIVSRFGGALDRLADKLFLADVFVFLISDGRIHISQKAIVVPLAVVETMLLVYWFLGLKKKMDVSAVKPKIGYGPGQIKMFLLSVATLLVLLNIVVEEYWGRGYHLWATVLLNIMFAVSLFFAVKSFIAHRIKYHKQQQSAQ
jgi:phosphatidylglycerophosphate synthase